MKKLLCLMLCGVAVSSHALKLEDIKDEYGHHQFIQDWIKENEEIKKNGRIKIVSSAEYAEKNVFGESKSTINKLGYTESTSKYPTILNDTVENPKFKRSLLSTNSDLRKSISEIDLAYKYDGIKSFNNIVDVTGYAPAGGYEENEGWSGLVEFFKHKDLGSCELVQFNIEIGDGRVLLNEEKISYEVAGHPTLTNIKGSNSTGFLYTVNWFTQIMSYDLNCASPQLKNGMINKMIDFASSYAVSG